MNILILEDDLEFAKSLEAKLEKSGHKATISQSIKDVLKKNLEFNHDVIILDILLDSERGEDLVHNLRKRKINIPVLVLSSLGGVESKVELLKAGADDYVAKPFDIKELCARLDALYRRSLGVDRDLNKQTFGEITFDWKRNKVSCGEKTIILTKKEAEVLHLLVAHKGEVVKSDLFLRKIWNLDGSYHSNILASIIKRLRKNLDMLLSKKLIRTVHGVGYAIDLD